ncbi:hypothetical protein HGRIS_013559 [Hohenbuehelia grisea]|uniref:Uncharacterized protein n=1 Tax=Hohenbuehelia grisea TaxID=104357 RepID=A0ABR3IVY1_9AGAR
MRYREQRTAEILEELTQTNGILNKLDDFVCGSEYLDMVRKGIIRDGDMVLVYSIDGAQLYRMKKSDCWIYIWVIFNLSPDKRYKMNAITKPNFS